MYSIVLLSAMAPGADVTPPVAPPPHVVAPVSGGCGGVVVGSCHGCTGYSCAGYSCAGSCHGGRFLGGGGGRFLGNRSSCHGCDGGRFIGGGLFHRSSCHGCTGYSCSGYTCFGSCHGAACHGGCYGSSWGPAVGMPPYTLHGYNSGVTPVWGAGTPVIYGAHASPNQPPVVIVPATMERADISPISANLKFVVPASAKLYVDGNLVSGTGTERLFFTPPLAAGKYFYDVKAEVVVDGQTVVEEKRVVVEAGANLTETFPKVTAAAAKASTVAGK